jgi:hypothetical protein
MHTPELPFSSWGKPTHHLDVRAVRRYNAILRLISHVGEGAYFVMATGAICMFFGFLFFGNFENAIFSDGTSLTCMLDGITGEVVNVDD